MFNVFVGKVFVKYDIRALSDVSSQLLTAHYDTPTSHTTFKKLHYGIRTRLSDNGNECAVVVHGSVCV